MKGTAFLIDVNFVLKFTFQNNAFVTLYTDTITLPEWIFFSRPRFSLLEIVSTFVALKIIMFWDLSCILKDMA